VSNVDRPQDSRSRSVEVSLGEFAWEALDAESARLGVELRELLEFALLYYLADVDSGRIARRMHGSPAPPPGA
jgi:hypothetical protein